MQDGASITGGGAHGKHAADIGFGHGATGKIIAATKRSGCETTGPDIEATTDLSCTPAVLSAMSMAWRTICSASTKSTTRARLDSARCI